MPAIDTSVDEPQPRIRIVVLIVAYNGAKLLADCLSSVRSADQQGLDVRYVVLDNASVDGTSALMKDRFPMCNLITSEQNLGFAGGNNRAWWEAQQIYHDIDFVYLLNQDTVVDAKFLVTAVDYLQHHLSVGAVQSLLLLHPETELINTAGNALHFLGFGFPTCYRQHRRDAPPSGSIGYPSGAAVLIRSEVLQTLDLFSPDLFMYLEDAELGLKLHLVGRPAHLCRESIVFHKYQFSSTLRSYGFLERNRWWLLAVHYRIATLALLLPAILLMEVGQLIYAAQNRLLLSKFRAALSFLSPSFLRQTIRSRRRIQSVRRLGDYEMLRMMTGRIESPHLTSRLINWVANPILARYHRCLCWIVRW